MALDPNLSSPLGLDAAQYLVKHSPDLTERLTLAKQLVAAGSLTVADAEGLIRASIESGQPGMMPSITSTVDSMGEYRRDQIANWMDNPNVITDDGGNWYQVLTWAVSIAPTGAVMTDLASRINGEAIAQPVLSDQVRLLDEAHQYDPSDAIIAANWAAECRSRHA